MTEETLNRLRRMANEAGFPESFIQEITDRDTSYPSECLNRAKEADADKAMAFAAAMMGPTSNAHLRRAAMRFIAT